jgi:glutathione S-transferase
MLRLHHMNESLCSQRVRLVLAEKELDWESAPVPPAMLRSPEYLEFNSAGVVPTLDHDGRILVESRIICEYLDEAFPRPPLMPLRPLDRYRARYWCKMYDDSFHLALFVLTFLSWMRNRYLDMAPDSRRQALPGTAEPVKREIAWLLCEQGWQSDIATIALERLRTLVGNLDAALADTRWLVGERYSLADVDMLATVQRLDDLGLSSLWDEQAALAGWFERARSRSSFEQAIMKWRTDEVARSLRASAEAAADDLSRILVGS